MINSQSQLEDKINLVKWEHQAERQRFSLLTIHSLLLDNNPKFKKLRQIVENYNNEKTPARIKLQQPFVEKLFKMLSELTRIPIFENQIEYLNKIYEWVSANRDFNNDNEDGEEQKQRPITATTKARTHSAYSRSTTNRPISGNYQKKVNKNEPLPPFKTIDPKIDYTKLKDGEKQFYCGYRTLHQQYEHPQKRLKEYQRKIFYEEDNDSDIEIIELDPKVEVNQQKLMDQIELAQQQEQIDGEGQEGVEGGQNQQAGDINIDDIPIEGEEEVVQGQEEQKIIIDKLRPKIKAYHDPKGINEIIHKHYYDGIAEIRKNANYKERKVDEDVEIASLGAIWAQTKGRTRSQLNRRAQSARMIKKTYGIKQQKKQSGGQEEGAQNFINFENVNPHNVNTKGSRPQTAFISTNPKNREELIKNAFITGKISGHVKKYEPGTSLSIPSEFNIIGSSFGAHADPPKKKTFEQILREAQEKVIRQSYDQVQGVKQAFAKNKICISGNRIAKSITHYDRQLNGDAFVGQITGTTMMKNPFIKVTKKKKKKKKK